MSNLANPDLANPNLADPDLADPNLAGGFSPTDLSGCVLWLRPDSSHVTLNGSDVSGITDRSSASNDASQGTAANQPLWQSSSANFNGYPSVRLDASADGGAGEWLRADGVASNLSGIDKPFSFVMALRFVATPTSGENVLAVKWSGGGTPFMQIIKATGTPDYQVVKRDDSSVQVSQAGGTPDTTARVVSVVCDGTTISVFVSGTAVIDGAGFDVGDTTLDQFSIGPNGSPVAAASDIEWADLAGYSRTITTTEREDVEGYITERYGL